MLPHNDGFPLVTAAFIQYLSDKMIGPVLEREAKKFNDSSPLAGVAQDYSVPVCYLADDLCTWGVPVPINAHERLGDMVTSEKAFYFLQIYATFPSSRIPCCSRLQHPWHS
jgi:hypothetical protein